MNITSKPFGKTCTGEAVTMYTMSNASGMTVQVLDYGCVIQSLIVPDKNGVATDVVLGYDTMEGYEKGNCFFGTFVGRYANRIGGASFPLNGAIVTLPANEGNNHLHGVIAKKVFAATVEKDALVLRYTSPDGEEGYPATVDITVIYTLSEDNQLKLEYQATADADTVVNFTNHSYFNLNGHTSGNVNGHVLQLSADYITETDAHSIPTGKLLPVAGTAFDFNTAKTVGQEIDTDHQQLVFAGGYDHNYVLKLGEKGLFAEVVGERSGIRMLCYTTQPGVQLYTGNFVGGDTARGLGKGGAEYGKRSALCLETQHYPDSPNQPSFPSTVLTAGELYDEVTVYQFA